MALNLRMTVSEAGKSLLRLLRDNATALATAVVIAAVALGLFAKLRWHEDALIDRLLDAEGRALANELTGALETRKLTVLDLARRWESIPDPDATEWARDAGTLAASDPVYRAFEWRDAEFDLRWSTPLIARLPGAELDSVFEAERVGGTTGVLQHATGFVSASFPGPGGRRLVIIAAPLLREGVNSGAIGAVARAQELIGQIVLPATRRGYSVAVREGPYHVFGPRASLVSELAERWRRTIVVRSGELVWSVDYWPDGEIMDRLHSFVPPVVLVLGLFAAVAAGAGVRALEVRRKPA